MISRLFASSSFFDGSSSATSAGFEPSGGGGLSSVFVSASEDCHRWQGRGDSGLKLGGWIDRRDNFRLELGDGVDNDLENVEDVNVRLCLISARRIMFRYQGVEGVGVEGKILIVVALHLQNFW